MQLAFAPLPLPLQRPLHLRSSLTLHGQPQRTLWNYRAVSWSQPQALITQRASEQAATLKAHCTHPPHSTPPPWGTTAIIESEMSEIVDTELLVNCTILAVRRFELNSIVNTTLLNTLNRTEVVGLLSGFIENRDNLESINEAK